MTNRLPPEGDQSTQPFSPPEMPQTQSNAQQEGTKNRVLGTPPVKDARLQTPVGWPPEKNKRHPSQRTEQPIQRNHPLRLPVWAVLLTFSSACGMTACVIVAVLALGGRTPAAAPPRFLIITAEASLTPVITIPVIASTPLLPPTLAVESIPQLAGPTLAPIIFTATPTPAPRIGLGSIIEVVGSNGINIRSTPGTDNTINIVLAIADPGDRFTVMEGPVTANGLTWWRVRSDDASVEGWAAETDGVQTLLQVTGP